jgi:outer membrane protein TolC
MRVALQPADYWKLRALIGDVQAAQHDLLSAEVRLRAAVTVATKARSAFFEDLAARYGFEPAREYGWDDTAQTLTAPD